MPTTYIGSQVDPELACSIECYALRDQSRAVASSWLVKRYNKVRGGLLVLSAQCSCALLSHYTYIRINYAACVHQILAMHTLRAYHI